MFARTLFLGMGVVVILGVGSLVVDVAIGIVLPLVEGAGVLDQFPDDVADGSLLRLC